MMTTLHGPTQLLGDDIPNDDRVFISNEKVVHDYDKLDSASGLSKI